MFHALGSGYPSSTASRKEPSRGTPITVKGPFHIGDSLFLRVIGRVGELDPPPREIGPGCDADDSAAGFAGSGLLGRWHAAGALPSS